jgi:glucose uptake protein
MYADFSLPEPRKVGPYSAAVLFSLGVLASNFLFNTVLMRKPVMGTPLFYAHYFKGTFRDHIVGILGGVLWGVGLIFSILSAGKAGFAISFGLGQGNAMVAAIWGVFILKKHLQAPRNYCIGCFYFISQDFFALCMQRFKLDCFKTEVIS